MHFNVCVKKKLRIYRSNLTDLVYKAFSSVKFNLNQIHLFHTNKENKFNIHMIDDILEKFKIRRYLSLKNCSYDNATSESTFKIT